MKIKTLAEMAVQIVNYKTKLPTFKLSITTHFSKKSTKEKKEKISIRFLFPASKTLAIVIGSCC
jgi:hypothetical protein